jgi:RNA recognition motif-containing protein
MRIYVGGLSYSVNDEGLRSLFSEFGEVADATVVSDRYSGQSKGFGFVEMPDAEQARAAISRLNGTAHSGRNLTVNEARPREEGGGGGSRGGGGGYGGGGNRGGGGGGGRRW